MDYNKTNSDEAALDPDWFLLGMDVEGMIDTDIQTFYF